MSFRPARSFNGAPAGCRGRLLVERKRFVDWWASMGPRQDAGEDSILKTKVDGEDGASMGPRQDAGEDYHFRWPGLIIRIASMGPRQDAGEDIRRSKHGNAKSLLLQWGPGILPGKTHAPSPALPAICAASMGPRQDAGEDYAFTNFSATSGELQWGPGRMPGKTRQLQLICFWSPGASMGPRQDAGEDIKILM